MKKFFWIFLLSNVAFHLSWPFRHRALPLQCQMLVEGVLYALLTYWLLKKYKDDGEPLSRILFPWLFGFLWLELPLRIVDFWGGVGSLLHMITTPSMIALVVYCYKRQNFKLFCLLAFIWLLAVILVEYLWDSFVTLSFFN